MISFEPGDGRYVVRIGKVTLSQSTFMVLAAVLVGMGGGFGAVAFRALIAAAGSLAFGDIGGFLSKYIGSVGVVVQLALGGTIAAFIASRFAPEAKGHGVPEVMEAVAGEWGGERVGVRLSPTNPYNDIADSTPAATFAVAVAALARFGLGYLHIVEPGAGDPVAAGEMPDLKFFRRHWRGVLIGNKGYDLDRANAAIAHGAADLVSFAALYLANPDLPERFRRGGPFNPPDRKTFYGGSAGGYTDYPPI